MQSKECFPILVNLLTLAKARRLNAARAEWNRLPKQFQLMVMKYVVGLAQIKQPPEVQGFTLETEYGRVSFAHNLDGPDIINLTTIVDLILDVTNAPIN